MRAPASALTTSITSSLGGAGSEPGDNSCPCISLSEDHVSPHHSCMWVDGSNTTPVAASFAAHSLAKSFYLCAAGMTSSADLGFGLPREVTKEDTSAATREKGRHKKVSCNKGAFRLSELLGSEVDSS